MRECKYTKLDLLSKPLAVELKTESMIVSFNCVNPDYSLGVNMIRQSEFARLGDIEENSVHKVVPYTCMAVTLRLWPNIKMSLIL